NEFVKISFVNLTKMIPGIPGSNLLLTDFFDLEEKFDLILEQTFFCALPLERRPEYVNKVHEILKPEGKVAGVLFNTKFDKAGPPFGGSRNEYLNLFKDKFYIRLLETSYNSITPRQGNELFFIFIT